MKSIAMAIGLAMLGGCGNQEATPAAATDRNSLAAAACDAYARTQLGDKTYALDRAALAATLVADPGGSMSMKAPITIEPGLSSESVQTLECSVRFVEGKDTPDVLRMQFIW